MHTRCPCRAEACRCLPRLPPCFWRAALHCRTQADCSWVHATVSAQSVLEQSQHTMYVCMRDVVHRDKR